MTEQSTKLTPQWYTSREGGPLLPWPADPISYDQLSNYKLGHDIALINGVTVHSLIFAVTSRWDSLNGWTTELPQLFGVSAMQDKQILVLLEDSVDKRTASQIAAAIEGLRGVQSTSVGAADTGSKVVKARAIAEVRRLVLAALNEAEI